MSDTSTVYDQFVSVWREIDDGRYEALRDNQDLPMLINEKQKGVTPLFLAVKRKNISMVLLLLANGADPNVVCKGATPLWLACFHGLVEVIHPLLDNGADPNCICQDSTPLHVAAVRGLVEVCEILCRFERGGANVNLTTDRLGSPLHVAVSHDHKYVLETLMKFDPDMTTTNKYGETVFHLACRLDDTSIAMQFLKSNNPTLNPFQRDLEHGATVAHVASSLTLFRALIKRWPDLLHANDGYGRTPTYYISHDSLALFTSLTSKPLQQFGEDLYSVIHEYADIELVCPSHSNGTSLSSVPSKSQSKEDKAQGETEIDSVANSLLQASIEVPTERILAHKAMLWARVPYFRQLLVPGEFNGQKTSEKEILEIPDISAEIMRAVVYYVYTDQIKVHSSNAKALLAAAKKLELKRLADLARGKLNLAVEPGPSTYAQEMAHLKKEGAFGDVKVHAESRTLAGLTRDYLLHRFILAAQSEFFHTMFASGMRESQTGLVELAPCILDTLDAFFHWIYTAEFISSLKTHAHSFYLLELANNYMNTSLSLPLQTRILHKLIHSDYEQFDFVVVQAERLHAQIVYEQCAVAYAGKSSIHTKCQLSGEHLEKLQQMAAPRQERMVRRAPSKATPR